jgi:hypothetical protein
MSGTAAAEAAVAIEQGSVTFLYRPRVEEYHADELEDVQRLLILLSPEGSAFQRAIAIGRKRLCPAPRGATASGASSTSSSPTTT